MSEQDESIDALLRTERGAPGMPEDIAERLAQRLQISLAGAPTGVANPTASPAPTAGATANAAAAATTLAGRALQVALIFTVGAGAGVFVDRTWVREAVAVSNSAAGAPDPSVRTDPPAPPIASSETAAVGVNAPVSEGVEPGVGLPETRTPQTPRAPDTRAVENQDDQNEAIGDTERLWIERAEAAFGRGETRAALAALSTHRRHFPRGRMVEERDALEVRVLYLAGQRSEADRLADRFRAGHPRSVFLRQIEAARGASRAPDEVQAPVAPTPERVETENVEGTTESQTE